MSSLDKDIYIVIPVHNRKEITLGCLNNLERVGVLEKYSVVVVDDGSTDGTGDAIATKFPSILLLKGTGDLWWTGAIKLGMEYAYQRAASHIFWLNDDCYPTADVFESIAQYCDEHTAIVGAQGYKSDSPQEITFGGKVKTWKGFRLIRNLNNEVRACDLLSGNLVCIPRQIITTIGYPDPMVAPHYGGDSLYLVRAKKAGFDLFIDARHTIYDAGDQGSRLYPTDWLAAEGEALHLIRLVLTPQSGLSWRIWLRLNWETYGYWGLAMFAKKYLSIILLTLIRLLPLFRRDRSIFAAAGESSEHVT